MNSELQHLLRLPPQESWPGGVGRAVGITMLRRKLGLRQEHKDPTQFQDPRLALASVQTSPGFQLCFHCCDIIKNPDSFYSHKGH